MNYASVCSGVEAASLAWMPLGWEAVWFSDNHTRIPWRGKPEDQCPDSPRYKACGNSMCVNVMRWIGMRIENVERRMNSKARGKE